MDKKRLADAYIFGIPFGLFGAHHFYLKRNSFGILYFCTLGLFGIGYIFDLVRMRWLVRHVNRYGNDKKVITDYYLIGFVGGFFGAHHFYLGNKKLGLLYLCTLGVFGVGWIVDLLRMRQLVEASNSSTDSKSLVTSYILACQPLGIFGAHHYYLENYGLGITYTCTLGIFGIGWIVDLFRMEDLVKASNDDTGEHGMAKITAYVLCVSPLGLFGIHHFYLKRYLNGALYMTTCGLFGFGWLFDILRLPVLYERYAKEDKHKYADEAYLFWFPFGLFGMHRFYMGETRMGIIYACTFGCAGCGWIIDGLTLPKRILDFNKTIESQDFVVFRICRPNLKACSPFKCPRCCSRLFTFCSRCEICKLSRKPRVSQGTKYEAGGTEGSPAMCEAGNSSQLTDLKQTTGKIIATVQDTNELDMAQHEHVLVSDKGAHPTDLGYINKGDEGRNNTDSPNFYESMSETADS